MSTRTRITHRAVTPRYGYTDAMFADLKRLAAEGLTSAKIVEGMAALYPDRRFTRSSIISQCQRKKIPLAHAARVFPGQPPPKPKQEKPASYVGPRPAPADVWLLVPPPGPATPGPKHPCCWPLWGSEGRPTHVYCCAPADLGASYCPAHRAVAWVKPRAPAAAAPPDRARVVGFGSREAR